MTIWFDMDGTIANLYGEENWLSDIKAEKTTPYDNAKPMINMEKFAYLCDWLQNFGVNIGIISWVAKNGKKQYNLAVENAKKEWLSRNCDIDFDKIINQDSIMNAFCYCTNTLVELNNNKVAVGGYKIIRII